MSAAKKLTLFRPILVDIPGLDLDQLRKRAKKRQARLAKRSQEPRYKSTPIHQHPEPTPSVEKDPLCVIFPNGLSL